MGHVCDIYIAYFLMDKYFHPQYYIVDPDLLCIDIIFWCIVGQKRMQIDCLFVPFLSHSALKKSMSKYGSTVKHENLKNRIGIGDRLMLKPQDRRSDR